jgi:hypothetical protein
MDLGNLGTISVAFVFVAVVLGIGGTILSDVQDTQTASSYAYNATSQGLESVDTLSQWLPTIAIVLAASVVIGALAFFKA